MKNNQLIEQMVEEKKFVFIIYSNFQSNRNDEIEGLKTQNEILQNEINEINLNLQKTCEQFQKQIGDYAKQSVRNFDGRIYLKYSLQIEYDNRFEQQIVEMNDKEKIFKDLKVKHDELLEKMVRMKNKSVRY